MIRFSFGVVMKKPLSITSNYYQGLQIQLGQTHYSPSIRLSTQIDRKYQELVPFDPAPAAFSSPRSEMTTLTTGHAVRLASRNKSLTTPTCGLAPGHIQANLIIVPSVYAPSFQDVCTRNPVPCPLLAKSATPGDLQTLVSCIPGISSLRIATDIDLRTDAPRYNIYIDGDLQHENVTGIPSSLDLADHIAFLIGCSYSFETALSAANLTPPHILHGRNVPMYRTTIPLCPAGALQGGTYIVSLRMYAERDIPRIREITRPFGITHGEPIGWGWECLQEMGVRNLERPEWGDAPVLLDGRLATMDNKGGEYVPVVWGCGVTPQDAVMRAGLGGVVIGHAPGHMIVLDIKDEDILGKS